MSYRPVPPPNDLSERGKQLWRAAQRGLRRQGTWQDTDATALERYVRAVELAESARAIAAREPFVPGSRKQLVAHPAVKVAAEANRDADRYAAQLLLTPAARRRAGIAPRVEDELARLLA